MNLEKNIINQKDGQLNIDFSQEDSSLDFERANKVLEELNTKYPYAKLFVEYKGNGKYFVSDSFVEEKDLEHKFKITNDVYKPEKNEKWYDK